MEYQKATMGDVVKLEKAGDSLEGRYTSIKESRKFKGSYALRIKTKDGLKTVFVSNIVKGLLDANQVKSGQQVKLIFTGKTQNEAKTFEYNEYDLLIAKQ